MASTNELFQKLKADGIVYMKDDYYDCAFRKEYQGDTYLKYKGCRESKVKYSNETVFRVELGGVFISKEEYERF